MNLSSLTKKPLIAAAVAATIALPVSAVYLASATHAVATAAPAAAMTAPASASPGVTLPDFSSMVQKYGPAVVNIRVTSKVQTNYSQGDDNGDDNENGNQG